MTAGQIGSGITGLKVSERGADAIDYSEGLEALLETAEAAGVALDTIFDPELAARVERWRRLGELSAELDEMGNLSDADWEALDALRQDTSIQTQSLGDIFGAVFEQMRDWLLAADALPERAEQDGYQTGQGLAEGMYESGDLVAAAGTYLGETAAAAIEAALNLANNPDQEWTYSAGSDAWTLSVVSAVVRPVIADEEGVSVYVIQISASFKRFY